jgi:hypothetical protein
MGLAMELVAKVVLEVVTRNLARPEPGLRYITPHISMDAITAVLRNYSSKSRLTCNPAFPLNILVP